MSPLPHDTNAVFGLTLSNIGLFIASGLLLTLILQGTYGSLSERTAEISTTAHILNSTVETLLVTEDDIPLQIQLPTLIPGLQISCSTQLIHLTAPGSFGTTLADTQAWTLRPWPRNSTTWQSSTDLHRWLRQTTAHTGTMNDPVNDTILCSLQETFTSEALQLATNPMQYSVTRPLTAEKVTIYATSSTRTFFLLYQTSTEQITQT